MRDSKRKAGQMDAGGMGARNVAGASIHISALRARTLTGRIVVQASWAVNYVTSTHEGAYLFACYRDA